MQKRLKEKSLERLSSLRICADFTTVSLENKVFSLARMKSGESGIFPFPPGASRAKVGMHPEILPIRWRRMVIPLSVGVRK